MLARQSAALIVLALLLATFAIAVYRGLSTRSASTAWERIAARIEPGGRVPRQLALDAFATLVGPIPGGEVVPGELGVRSGSAPVRWLMRYWDDLSDSQQAAIRAALDSQPATPSQPLQAFAATPRTPRDGLQEFTDGVAAEFKTQVPAFSPARPFVVVGDPPYERETLAITSAARGGERVTSGPVDSCRIMYLPAAVQLFETSRYAGTSADGDRALAVLRAVVAHELMHCHQINAAQSAERYRSQPPWILEGSAAWGGFLHAYPSTPAHGSMNFWGQFFADSSKDLFDRAYDGIGFWAYARDPWGLLREALSLPWESAEDAFGLSDHVLAETRRQQGLGHSAMSFPRRPELGTAWQTVGPGIGDEHPRPPVIVTVGLGERRIEGPIRAFRYADLQFASDVQVVKVEPRADGALHWGKDNHGPDDEFVGTGNEAFWFCLKPGGCACPDPLEPKWWVPLNERPFSTAVLAFVGIHDLGPNTALAPVVEFSALTAETAAAELCRPRLPEAKGTQLEPTVCQTWFSRDDLIALVPGATRVPSEFAAPVGSRPDGTRTVSCFWDVQRNPLSQEPFFEWLLGLEAHLVLRGSQSAEQWSQEIHALQDAEGCRAAILPGGIPACVDEDETSADVVVSMGTDRLLVVRAHSSTTAGRPDYPTSQLHAATRHVAAAFAERLHQDFIPSAARAQTVQEEVSEIGGRLDSATGSSGWGPARAPDRKERPDPRRP
jgi:hypothetical protein